MGGVLLGRRSLEKDMYLPFWMLCLSGRDSGGAQGTEAFAVGSNQSSLG